MFNQDVLNLDIIGKQHLYKLNRRNRTVKEILIPAFRKELSVREDMNNFLKKVINDENLTKKIVSLILYGSHQKRTATEASDVDVAIITKNRVDKERVKKLFIEEISSRFYEYFGVHLDVYIKAENEFIERLRKNEPPVSTLMTSYTVISGKDPLDLK